MRVYEEREMLILERRLRLLKSRHPDYHSKYERFHNPFYNDVINISATINELFQLEREYLLNEKTTK